MYTSLNWNMFDVVLEVLVTSIPVAFVHVYGNSMWKMHRPFLWIILLVSSLRTVCAMKLDWDSIEMANCGESKTVVIIYSTFSLSTYLSFVFKSFRSCTVLCVLCIAFAFFFFFIKKLSTFLVICLTFFYLLLYDCFSSRSDLGGDIHEDNPSEELNLLLPENSNKHYGYPYCWSEGLLDHPRAGGPGIHHPNTTLTCSTGFIWTERKITLFLLFRDTMGTSVFYEWWYS